MAFICPFLAVKEHRFVVFAAAFPLIALRPGTVDPLDLSNRSVSCYKAEAPTLAGSCSASALPSEKHPADWLDLREYMFCMATLL